jgi:hypothetical protein
MSVNHDLKAVQIDRPSGTLLRLGKEFNVIFFKLLYGFYFLGCDSFMGVVPNILNNMGVVMISVTPKP